MSGEAKRERKQWSGVEKLAILKWYMVEKTPISDLCDEFQLQPSQIYNWQTQLFEQGSEARAEERSHRGTLGGERPRKESQWGTLTGRWVPPDTRDQIVDYVRHWKARTALPAK